jgi:hypothetical protein
MRDAVGRRGERACRRIIGHQTQKDLYAEAHADSAEEEEEVDGNEISFTEANGVASEIALSQKDGDTKTDTDCEGRSQHFAFAQKEKGFAQPVARGFTKPFSEEKETQIIAHAVSFSDGISHPFAQPERDT